MKSAELVREYRNLLCLTQHELATELGCHRRTVHRWESGEVEPKRLVIDRLRDLVRHGSTPQNGHAASFTFIDLFAGIGGMRMGFQAAGGRCVFTSEWDRFCRITYGENFGDHDVRGDIRTSKEEIPPHDVLVAGFPCQPFSIAGVSKKNALGRPHGFACDTQGTLFFEIAEILKEHRPAAFLLENVRNLISHDSGRTFKVIMSVLRDELGYWVPDPKIIDARSFVPQHRERIFIAGFREPTAFSWDDVRIPDAAPVLATILHPEDGSEESEEPYTLGPRGRVADKYTLSDHLWSYLRKYAERHRAKGNGFGYGIVGPADVARTLSARYYKDGSEILVRQRGRNPRRLTPRECARLMGFDRPGLSPFKIPVSDTQAYKQFGNAVVVPVVEAVASAMKPHVALEQMALDLRIPA